MCPRRKKENERTGQRNAPNRGYKNRIGNHDNEKKQWEAKTKRQGKGGRHEEKKNIRRVKKEPGAKVTGNTLKWQPTSVLGGGVLIGGFNGKPERKKEKHKVPVVF